MKKKKFPRQGFVEKIDVINRRNQEVGVLTMHEVHEQKLPHRTAHVLIFDTTGEKIFLQKRGPKVFIYPNYWTNSASGHVKSGDTYEKTACKEMKEELGIKCELKKVGWYWIEEGDNVERNEVFVGVHDGPFVFNDKDVPRGKWFEVEYIKNNYKKMKTCPYFRRTWEEYNKKLKMKNLNC